MSSEKDPSKDRNKCPFETEWEYQNRIKRLDEKEAMMKKFYELCVPRKELKP